MIAPKSLSQPTSLFKTTFIYDFANSQDFLSRLETRKPVIKFEFSCFDITSSSSSFSKEKSFDFPKQQENLTSCCFSSSHVYFKVATKRKEITHS